ncbi:HAD-like domain-containing protein [Halteromyces radiatus]|uniref:HAD-like domain-containing protein n=1 Tax=Halteromyces radiatus TaxID=101107 RepID=UPI00221F9BDC|nr:HAD-like domain-containing protein [Halteromyces radiatus]KAI8096921.1 HAD-like domain-containing protein [Halteromyces radiatus]
MSPDTKKRNKPSKAYLDQSDIPSVKLNKPMKQLLILDLNGTLVSRTKGSHSLYSRPYLEPFLDYIFDNFSVMVWSSATYKNVDKMCEIFGKHRKNLILIWTRSNFGLSEADYNRKVITIKDLELVWKELPKYNAKNTILMDDSPEKTILQPYNHCVISEFNHLSPSFKKRGENELIKVQRYLEQIRYEDNISNYIKHSPYGTTFKLNEQQQVEPENDDNDNDGYPTSCLCYHYMFPQHGNQCRRELCDLGMDDIQSKLERIKL